MTPFYFDWIDWSIVTGLFLLRIMATGRWFSREGVSVLVFILSKLSTSIIVSFLEKYHVTDVSL